jgi:hypothetical protein
VSSVAGTGFALPSSAAVPCTERAGSSLVVATRLYVADIQVYDRSDLTPLGAGSPVMVDAKGSFVAPRWTTSCGRRAGGAATAYAHVTRLLADCDPLNDALGVVATTGAVSITIDPTTAAVSCGTSPGELANLQASLTGSSETSEAACGSALHFDGLPAGRPVTMRVLGFESGSNVPRWGTECTATPIAGIEATATCDPLLDGGTVAFDLAALLSGSGHECATDIVSVSVVSSDGTLSRNWAPPSCTAPLDLDGVPTGNHTFDLTTTLSGGSAGPRASCTATAQPGLVATATCQLVP